MCLLLDFVFSNILISLADSSPLVAFLVLKFALPYKLFPSMSRVDTKKRQGYYILICCPAQQNIKHLSCSKQPLMGCVNTSRV